MANTAFRRPSITSLPSAGQRALARLQWQLGIRAAGSRKTSRMSGSRGNSTTRTSAISRRPISPRSNRTKAAQARRQSGSVFRRASRRRSAVAAPLPHRFFRRDTRRRADRRSAEEYLVKALNDYKDRRALGGGQGGRWRRRLSPERRGNHRARAYLGIYDSVAQPEPGPIGTDVRWRKGKPTHTALTVAGRRRSGQPGSALRLRDDGNVRRA